MANPLIVNPYARKKFSKEELASVPDLRPDLSEAGKGIRAFADETQATGYGVLALGAQQLKDALGTGNGGVLDSAVQAGQEGYSRNIKEATAGRQAPNIARVEDIKDFGGGVDWAAYNLAKGLPQLATLAAGSGAGALVGGAAKMATTKAVKAAAKAEIKKSMKRGAVVGGFAGAFGLEGGHAMGQALEAGVDPSKAADAAAVIGGINGALEFLPFYAVAKKLGRGDFAKKGIREIIKNDAKLSKRAVTLAAAKEAGKRAGKAGAMGAGVEGVTEGLQELVNIAGLRWAENEDMFADLDPEDWSQIKNAMAAGGLIGGVAGGGAGVFKGPTAPVNPDGSMTEIDGKILPDPRDGAPVLPEPEFVVREPGTDPKLVGEPVITPQHAERRQPAGPAIPELEELPLQGELVNTGTDLAVQDEQVQLENPFIEGRLSPADQIEERRQLGEQLKLEKQLRTEEQLALPAPQVEDLTPTNSKAEETPATKPPFQEYVKKNGQPFVSKRSAEQAAKRRGLKNFTVVGLWKNVPGRGDVRNGFAIRDRGQTPKQDTRMTLKELNAISDPTTPISQMEKKESGYLDNLQEQIERDGITRPIDVATRNGKPVIIADGNHRLAIMRRLGMKDAPVRLVDEAQMEIEALAEDEYLAAGFTTEEAKDKSVGAARKDLETIGEVPVLVQDIQSELDDGIVPTPAEVIDAYDGPDKPALMSGLLKLFQEGELTRAQYSALRAKTGAGDLEFVYESLKQVEQDGRDPTKAFVKAKASADLQQLIALLGSQMYKSGFTTTVVKELAQNSLDTVRSVANVTGTPGRVDIVVNPVDRYIASIDNGEGMTAADLNDKFLKVGGTGKGGIGTAGGKGLAKTAFIYGAERVEVRTVKDGKASTIKATPTELYSGETEIQVEDTNEPNGTEVIIYVPEKVYVDDEARDVRFPYSEKEVDFLARPLLGPLEFYFNLEYAENTPPRELIKGQQHSVEQADDGMYVVKTEFGTERGGFDTKEEAEQEAKSLSGRKKIGIALDLEKEGYTKLSPMTTKWGDIEVFVGQEYKKYPDHAVLSAGVFQFDLNLRDGNRKSIPYEIVINITSKVDTKSPLYPFTNSREEFSPGVEADITALRSFLMQYFSGIASQEAVNTFKGMQQLPHVNVDEGLTQPSPEELAKIKPSSFVKPLAVDDSVMVLPTDVEIRDGKVYGTVKGKKGPQVLADPKNENKHEKSLETNEDDITKVEDVVAAGGYDPSKPIFHNNTTVDFISEFGQPAAQFFAEMGSAVLDMLHTVDGLGMYGYTGFDPKADNPVYGGISIDKRYEGLTLKSPTRAFFLNPLVVPGDIKSLPGIASAQYLTMIHEIAHNARMDHDETHTLALHEMYNNFAEYGKDIEFQERFASIYYRHKEIFNTMRSKYERSDTRNVAKSLDEIEGVEGGKLGSDVSGPDINPSQLEEERLRRRRSEAVPGSSRDGQGVPGNEGRVGAEVGTGKLESRARPTKPWIAINNAYGDWGIIGTFDSKREAIEAVQIYEGTDARPSKYGDIGNHSVMKTADAFTQFDGLQEQLVVAELREIGADSIADEVERLAQLSPDVFIAETLKLLRQAQKDAGIPALEAISNKLESQANRVGKSSTKAKFDHDFVDVFGAETLQKATESGLLTVNETSPEGSPAGEFNTETNQITINLDQVGEGETPMSVLLHEGRHAGMQDVLGDTLPLFHQDLLDLADRGNEDAQSSIIRSTAAVANTLNIDHSLYDLGQPNSELEAEVKSVRKLIAEREQGNYLLQEEDLAYYIQDAANTTNLTAPGLYRRLINALKIWWAQSTVGQMFAQAGLRAELTPEMAVELAKAAVKRAVVDPAMQESEEAFASMATRVDKRTMGERRVNRMFDGVVENERRKSQEPRRKDMAVRVPLAMDKASRMRRARKMGFDTTTTYYHGTDKDFDEFSDDAKGDNTGWRNSHLGHFFLNDKQRAQDFIDETAGGGRVVEVLLALKNPINITLEAILTNESQASTIVEALGGEKMDGPAAIEFLDDNIGLGEISDLKEQLDTEEAKAVMEAHGYDGIIGDFGANVNEFVVFKPSQVRSVDAAFDPAKTDSANLLASEPTDLNAHRKAKELEAFRKKLGKDIDEKVADQMKKIAATSFKYKAGDVVLSASTGRRINILGQTLIDDFREPLPPFKDYQARRAAVKARPKIAGYVVEYGAPGDKTTSSMAEWGIGSLATGPQSLKSMPLPPGVVYHVTSRKNVSNIQAGGIKPLQASNWGNRDGERINTDGGVYAFSSAEEALQWAFKHEFELKEPVSILTVKQDGEWEQDPHMNLLTKNSLQRKSAIKANQITDVYDFDMVTGMAETGLAGQAWIKEKAKEMDQANVIDLPMDEASRLKRAKEQGFDTDTVLYHGTMKDFSSFSKTAPDIERNFGEAQAILGHFFTPAAHYARDYADTFHAGQPGAPTMIPVYVRGNFKHEPYSVINDIEANDDIKEAQEYKDKLVSQGYDGVIFSNNQGKVMEYVIFESENIRSVNAVFDPAQSENANLLASMPNPVDYVKRWWGESTDTPLDAHNVDLAGKFRAHIIDNLATIDEKSTDVHKVAEVAKSKTSAEQSKINRLYLETLVQLAKVTGLNQKQLDEWLLARHVLLDDENWQNTKKRSWMVARDLALALPSKLRTQLNKRRVSLTEDRVWIDKEGKLTKVPKAEVEDRMVDLVNEYFQEAEKLSAAGSLGEQFTAWRDLKGSWIKIQAHSAGLYSPGKVDANGQLLPGQPKRANVSNAPDAYDIYHGYSEDKVQQDALQAMAEKWDEMTQHQLDLLVEGGKITDEEKIHMREAHPHYVKSRRTSSDNDKSFEFLNAETASAGKPKVRAGTIEYDPVVHVMQNTIAQAHSNAQAAQQNQAALYLYREVTGNPKHWDGWFTKQEQEIHHLDTYGFLHDRPTSSPEKVDIPVTIMADDGKSGKTVYLRPVPQNQKAKLFAAGMNKLGVQNQGAVAKVLGFGNKIVRNMAVTFSPAFLAANIFRDPATALYNLQATEGKEYTKDFLTGIEEARLRSANEGGKDKKGKGRAGLGAAWKILNSVYTDRANADPQHIKWVEEWEHAGGRQSFTQALKEMDDGWKSFESSLAIARKPGISHAYKGLEWVEKYNIIVENMSRFSAYSTVMEAWERGEITKWDTKEKAQREAAIISKELTTNFDRKGFSSQAIGLWHLFFNATVQGNVQVVRNLAKSKKLQKMVAGSVVTATMFDLLGRMSADDDDEGRNEWDNIPDYIKERNIILPFKIGGVYVKIPAPWVYNTVWRTGGMIGELAADKRDAASLPIDLGLSLMNTFNPMASASLMQSLSPTILDPFVQAVENKNFAGNPIKPTSFPGAAALPESQLYWNSTPKAYIGLAQTLNALTGGDVAKSGFIDISPGVIHNFVNFFTAGVGKAAGQAYDLASIPVSDKEFEVKDVPILSTYATTPGKQVDVQLYHDRVAQILQAEKAITLYGKGKTRDVEKQRESRVKYARELRLVNHVKDVERQLKSLRTRMRAAQGRKDVKRVKDLKSRLTSVQQKFNKTYEQRMN